MSYAVGTPHYNLPQTTGNDKRDWFDTNQAFLALDGDVYDAKTTADSVAQDMSDVVQSVENLGTRVGTAEGDIDNLESGLATANENIGINATAIGNLSTQVGDVKQDMKDAICSIEETSATAQYRHEVGTFFWYNDTLYKTTVLIPVGNTIVPNTNCETTNVTTELIAIGGSGLIDDTVTSSSKVWSSQKVSNELSNKQNATDNSLQTNSKQIVGAINEVNSALCGTLKGSQIGAGSNTVSVANASKILCVVKKSNVVLCTKYIPTAILSANDVIPLGANIQVFGESVADSSTAGAVLRSDQSFGWWTVKDESGTAVTAIRINADSVSKAGNAKLYAGLSSAVDVNITYNGTDSYTLTSVAGVDVYLYA